MKRMTIVNPTDSAGAEMEYLTRLPRAVPPCRVLVHNHVRPARRLGSRGFRAWLASPDPERLAICECGWAPELGRHFRVRRDASLASRRSDR